LPFFSEPPPLSEEPLLELLEELLLEELLLEELLLEELLLEELPPSPDFGFAELYRSEYQPPPLRMKPAPPDT
jgi:hypothetical protein